MTTKNFTYNNLYICEIFDKKKLEEEIIKLSPVEFYLYVLSNETNLKNKHSVEYYVYLLEYYIEEYYIEEYFEIYEDKISNKKLKQYDITFYDLICNIHINLKIKSIFQKKISNYFNDLDNEKYQIFDEKIILNSYENDNVLLSNETLIFENINNINKYLPSLEMNLNKYINSIKIKFPNEIKHKIKQNKKIIWFNSIFDMVIINFEDGNYNQMKKYLNILIEKNDLKAMLFMALFYKYFEKNKTEEIKYYLKIHKYINEIHIEALKDYDDIDYDLVDECGIYLESMYYLSLCYLENKQYKKAFYISIDTIKFIDLNNLISYINDDLNYYNNSSLLSNEYFKTNISMYYIYFKLYNNIIETCEYFYGYDWEIYYDKYILELEYILNYWKF